MAVRIPGSIQAPWYGHPRLCQQSIHILIPYFHFKTLWVLQRILLTNHFDTTLIVGVIRFRKSFTVAMTRKQLAGNE